MKLLQSSSAELTAKFQTLAATGHTRKGIVQRMSVTYDPQNSSFKGRAQPFTSPKSPCHSVTIHAAIKRGNPEDKIWLFGAKPDSVLHSLLTDENNRVLADAYSKSGKFTEDRYFRLDLDDAGGEYYDFIDVLSVGDLIDETMEYTAEAAVKGLSNYSLFGLRNPLTLQRRGKEVRFKRGHKLGWRFSSNGKFFRLVDPMDSASIVYSIPVTEDSLAWLVRHDPKAQRKLNSSAVTAGSLPAAQGFLTKSLLSSKDLPTDLVRKLSVDIEKAIDDLTSLSRGHLDSVSPDTEYYVLRKPGPKSLSILKKLKLSSKGALSTGANGDRFFLVNSKEFNGNREMSPYRTAVSALRPKGWSVTKDIATKILETPGIVVVLEAFWVDPKFGIGQHRGDGIVVFITIVTTVS